MRNQEFNKRGSSWRKWDLHVHTPYSIVQHFGTGDDVWENYLNDLETLPDSIKVLGINDYMFIDGYERLQKEKYENDRLKNIELLLPVVEFRIEKFAGVDFGNLKRMNLHVIFSQELSADLIKAQFLNPLQNSYVLNNGDEWNQVITPESIEDLGRRIKEGIPDEELQKYDSDFREGFNGLNVKEEQIFKALERDCFKGKALTAIGKTEWASLKWSDQSIPTKKSIINAVDLVFTAAEGPNEYRDALDKLKEQKVNHRLLDCSDAHYPLDSENKDRLGNTSTWIKSDSTFEGLKQALFEFESRVIISENEPVVPVNQIEKVSFNFPYETELKSNEAKDIFCFRGHHEFSFSPYFTAIIGGRGSGKSTLINLVAESIKPGKSKYFKQRELIPDSVNIQECVEIEGVTDPEKVEFLEQNEIENFAVDYKEFTNAIYQRLFKLDDQNKLKDATLEAQKVQEVYISYKKKVEKNYELLKQKQVLKSQLSTQKSIVESFTDDEYLKLNDELKELTTQKQALETSKNRFSGFNTDIKEALEGFTDTDKDSDEYNEYDIVFDNFYKAIQELSNSIQNNPILEEAEMNIRSLSDQISTKKVEIEKFLDSKGHSLENLKDISGANERIASLESQLTEVRQSLTRLESDTKDEPFNRDLIDVFQAEINAILKPINENLTSQNDQVKPIRIEFKFDDHHFINEIKLDLIQEIKRYTEEKVREDHIATRLEEVNFKELHVKEDILDVINDDAAVTTSVMKDYFNDPLKFELLKIFIEHELLELRKYGRFNIYYDERPLENNSFGQRCTAALVILLLLGNTPIIIDEPEAHLDSKLIAEYLVNLIKEKKLERQIIFATHNANFVVNGDADLILCLSIDDTSKVTNCESITIEDKDSRPSLLALEGGKEAFESREDRYGLRL